MNFDRNLTMHLVIPGGLTTAFLIAAALSPSIRAATIPLVCAIFTGLFSFTYLPHALQTLTREPSYRNARNYGTALLALVGALAPVACLITVVAFIIAVSFGHYGGAGA